MIRYVEKQDGKWVEVPWTRHKDAGVFLDNPDEPLKASVTNVFLVLSDTIAEAGGEQAVLASSLGQRLELLADWLDALDGIIGEYDPSSQVQVDLRAAAEQLWRMEQLEK